MCRESAESRCPQRTFAVSSDFWLGDLLKERRLNYPTRLLLQLRRYRTGGTFGVIENKLLRHSFLRALLGKRHPIQPIPVLYGAFAASPLPATSFLRGSGARGGMGGWRAYRRADLVRALGKKNTTRFVLKPLNGGMDAGMLIMTEDRWEKEKWTSDNVVSFAERQLSQLCSEWGQHFEHLGIVVQPMCAPLPALLSVDRKQPASCLAPGSEMGARQRRSSSLSVGASSAAG